MKKTLAFSALSLIMVACGSPTMEEEVAGSYELTDFTADGSIDFMGQTITVSVEDSLINSSSLVLVHDKEAGDTYTMDYDMRIRINTMGQSLGQDLAENMSGTWRVVDGEGVTPDSIYLNDGTAELGFEFLSRLETMIRIRTIQDMDAGGGASMGDMSAEYGFSRI